MEFIRSLCFGLTPSEFLQQELQLSSAQSRIAWRIFILLMVFTLISVTTRLPSSRTVAFFLAILIPQMVFSTRMAWDSLVLITGLIFAGILFGLITVVLSQDQGYFRLPLSLALIVLMMFHARVNRYPNILPIFYGTLALYQPSEPLRSIDSALWDLVILGGGAILSCVLLATVLWPTEARTLLRSRIRDRLTEMVSLLIHLQDLHQRPFEPNQEPRFKHLPGWTSDTLKQLDDMVRDHPQLEPRKAFWLEAMMELESLHSGLIGYANQLISGDSPRHPQGAVPLMLDGLQQRIEARLRILDQPGSRSTAPVLLQPEGPLPPILQRMILTSHRLEAAVERIDHGAPESGDMPAPRVPDASQWIRLIRLKSYQNTLLWSLKVAMACWAVTLLVVSMNASEVDTAIITTIIVADSTLGADYRKSLMRVTGALAGALLGYLWLILGQPVADTVAGLLVTLIPPFYLCARLAATSPRLNYAGLQMGLAFCLVVFSEQAPGDYLGTGWYRVLGILLGISVMGVMDYLFWPARSVDVARGRLQKMLDDIQQQLSQRVQGFTLDLEHSLYVLRSLDLNIRDAAYFLDFAKMEPGAMSPGQQGEIRETTEITQCFIHLSKIIGSRHRLFLRGDSELTHRIYNDLLTALVPHYQLLYAELIVDLGQRRNKSPSLFDPAPFEVAITEFSRRQINDTTTPADRSYLEAVIDLERLYQAQLLSLLQLLSEPAAETHPVSEIPGVPA